MGILIDRQFLKEQQYRRADNLEARIRLHRDWSVQAQDWQRWVFDRLALAGGERVLEVGCGPASLWRENTERLPAEPDVTLGDLSWGMVDQARQNMGGAKGFRYASVDVQALPFTDGQFDVAIANHMLYHAPDLPQAVGELRRVVKPGGRVLAATNGLRHMQALFDLVHEFDTRAAKPEELQSRFCLENAAQVLGQSFERVEIWPFESRLEVRAVQPLVDYILSMASFWGVIEHTPPGVGRLEQFLAEKMAVEGKIVIQKAAGIAAAF
jgi:ubiquinone/menaquinone biosynthesis C-methylase UbiE